MKTKLFIATVLVSVVVGLVGIVVADFKLNFIDWSAFKPDPPTVRSLGPTVTELEKMGDFVVTRLHVSDVLEATGLGRRGVWLVKGDALIVAHMGEARVENKDTEMRTATIVLPRLDVLSPRVDHERTRIYDMKTMTWLPWKRGDEGQLTDNAMWHAQQMIKQAARQDNHIAIANDMCVLLLKDIYRQVDWEVDVRWDTGYEEVEDVMLTIDQVSEN